MSDIIIRHPFPGAEVFWNFAQHVAAGYMGGTDWKVAAGQDFPAPAAGWAEYIGDGQVIIHLSDGRRIGCRELSSTTVPRTGRSIKLGEPVGRTGRKVFRNGKLLTLFPHGDGITAAGVRVPLEPWLTTTAGDGNVTPLPTTTEGEEEMLFLSHSTQSIWYLIGEYTVTRTRDLSTARQWKQGHGASRSCDSAALRELILVTENNAAVRAAETVASVKTALTGVTVAPVIDYARIARDVDAQLADDFAGIGADVVDTLKE